MKDPEYQDNFPKGALVGAALLLGATLCFVGYMRLTGTEPAATEHVAQEDIATAEQLKFADSDSGDVIVYRVESDDSLTPIAILPPGTNGFLRSVMRGLVQARHFDDIGRRIPFTLARLTDGRLILTDPATGRVVDLRAFGHTNAEAFARLLSAQPLSGAELSRLAHTSSNNAS